MHYAFLLYSSHRLTTETPMRFNVVAAYQRYDSNDPRSLIHPDHSAKLMIEKERNVSIARKNLGLLNRRPTWAIIQYSIGDIWPAKWSTTLVRFINKSTEAQRITSHPSSTWMFSVPVRIINKPKSILKTQNGKPIVRAWNVGVWKKLSSILWDVSCIEFLSVLPSTLVEISWGGISYPSWLSITRDRKER